MAQPTAFLDRDGTVVRDHPDDRWSDAIEPEFLPGAIEAIRTLHRKGFALVILTNQYLIGEGRITQAGYDRFAAVVAERLRAAGAPLIDQFYCPHARGEGCGCRKPAQGLLNQALERHGNVIGLDGSFLVGDASTDMELAVSAGLRGFAVGFEFEHPDVRRVEMLADVVDFV